MADAYELVIYLLLLGLKLHFVWKWLPFATSANAEVFAEWLQTMLGWLYHTEDESFHIVLFLLGHLYINNVTRYCELYEKYCSVNFCECLAFCCNRLDHNIFQNYFLLLSCHISAVFLFINSLLFKIISKHCWSHNLYHNCIVSCLT